MDLHHCAHGVPRAASQRHASADKRHFAPASRLPLASMQKRRPARRDAAGRVPHSRLIVRRRRRGSARRFGADLMHRCDNARVCRVVGMMGRFAYVLAILLTVGAFVVVGCVEDENGHGYEPLDVHAAETADERAAAELGERYAQAVDRGDLKTACDLAIEEAAERLRCGASPAPGDRMQRPQGLPRQGRGRLHRRPTRHVRAPRRAPRRRVARHRGRRDEGLRLTRELSRSARAFAWRQRRGGLASGGPAACRAGGATDRFGSLIRGGGLSRPGGTTLQTKVGSSSRLVA